MLFASLYSHPLHVSFTSIDINPVQREVNLSVKLYTEDLKLVVFHLYEEQINPEVPQELTGNQLRLINRYMDRSFTLVSETDTVDLEYVRKEFSDEYIWLHFKGSLPGKDLSSLWLTNMILLDLYEDQTNLVILINGKHEQGYTFNYLIRRLEMGIKED